MDCKFYEIEMVLVEAGTFTMGNADGEWYAGKCPTRQVTLTNSYYIGKYPVTQAQWKAVMGNNPSYFKGDDLPVEQVSWEDIRGFIAKLNEMTGKNYRLPTEAEWEYAARGGNESKGYKYIGSDDIDAVAWHNGNSDNKTHPVGTKQPNELGIYDMNGNVFEWCYDWHDFWTNNPETNPQGTTEGSTRVFRGGGWNTDAEDCRVSDDRGSALPSYCDADLGFRVALSF